MTVPYDIDKDLIPVVRFVDLPILLAASNERAVQVGGRAAGVAEGEARPHHCLCLGRRRQPARICGASTSRRSTGLPLEHVGYKGSAEALRDVIGGHVPLFSDVLVPTGDGGQGGPAARPRGGDDPVARSCCPTCPR